MLTVLSIQYPYNKKKKSKWDTVYFLDHSDFHCMDKNVKVRVQQQEKSSHAGLSWYEGG